MIRWNHVVVDIQKLRDYCLSEHHLRGRHKALVFRALLGLTAADSDFLRAALLRAAEESAHNFQIGALDEYGQRYLLDFLLTTHAGTGTGQSHVS